MEWEWTHGLGCHFWGAVRGSRFKSHWGCIFGPSSKCCTEKWCRALGPSVKGCRFKFQNSSAAVTRGRVGGAYFSWCCCLISFHFTGNWASTTGHMHYTNGHHTCQCIMINALYRPYSFVCMLCRQRALEESRWRELEQTRERSARLLYGDKPYSQSAQRLTAFNAVTMATWAAVAGASPDLYCSVLRPGFFWRAISIMSVWTFLCDCAVKIRQREEEKESMEDEWDSWAKALDWFCAESHTVPLCGSCVLFIRVNKDTVGVCYHILLQKNMCTREYIHGPNQLTHGYVCVRKQHRCTHSNSLCWLPFWDKFLLWQSLLKQMDAHEAKK